MEVWEAVVLGLVQGLTEFLPVSSSGHLQIFNTLFGLQGEENLTFAVAVHAATVCSTIVVFRIKPRTETNTSARLIAVFGIDEQGHRPIVDEVYFHVRTKDPGWNIPPKIVL